jgi:hypothetical protein
VYDSFLNPNNYHALVDTLKDPEISMFYDDIRKSGKPQIVDLSKTKKAIYIGTPIINNGFLNTVIIMDMATIFSIRNYKSTCIEWPKKQFTTFLNTQKPQKQKWNSLLIIDLSILLLVTMEKDSVSKILKIEAMEFSI